MSKDFRNMMIEFANCGFKVFPYLGRFKKGDNGKGVPINANGTNDDKTDKWAASNDVSKVINWTLEDDIIGYGVTSKTCIIFDVDCGVGKAKSDQAITSFHRMKADLGLPKPSITVTSPSGGYHFYYKKPDFDTLNITSDKDFPGIDLPWHVTGPNSEGERVSGEYVLTGGHINNSLAPLSDEVLHWLKETHTKKAYKDPTAGLVMPADAEVFDGSIPDVIENGVRHYTMLRLIGSWVRQGITRANAIALIGVALSKCEGKSPKSLNDYIGELDNTLSKSTFNRQMPEPLAFFLKNMVYVKAEDGVYELTSRRFYNKGLRNVYAQHRWFIDPKDDNPDSKAQMKEVYAYDQWVKDKDRITVENIGYRPVREKIFKNRLDGNVECANLYQPPTIAKRGDDEEIWDLFVKLAKVIDPNKWVTLLEWAACQIQIPEKKLQIAIAMISEKRGVGKNLFLYIISDCIGKQNFDEVNSVEDLFDTHAEFPIKNHLIAVNEASTQLSDRYGQKSIERYMERTKDIISKRQFNVNIKFLRTNTVEFYTNFAFTSNNLHAIPMEENDRRFEIFMSNNDMLANKEYSRLWCMSEEDIAMIHHKLSELDLVTINETYKADKIDDNKQIVINASRSYVETDIVDAIKNHKSVFQADVVTFELFAWFVLNHSGLVSRGYCMDLFKKYCKPIYRRKGNTARDPKVECPALEFKGGDISTYYKSRQRYLYCVRNEPAFNSEKGRNERVSLYKDMYAANYSATSPNYVDPDVFYADEAVQELIRSQER